MSKIMIRLAGLVAVFAIVFGGVAQAAESTSGAPGTPERAAAQSTDETRAIVVGGVAFVLMVGAAGAVLWYTARSRRSTE